MSTTATGWRQLLQAVFLVLGAIAVGLADVDPQEELYEG